MTSVRKALVLGFLVWLLISVAIFPIRRSNRPMFESIMGIVVALAAASFLNLYFRTVERRFAFEGALLGMLWCALCVLCDLPLFLCGPMKMPMGAYFSEIGSGYLMIPAVSIPVGVLLDRKRERVR